MGTTMLSQYSKVDLTQRTDIVNKSIEDFSSLPLHFMKYYGSTDPDELFATLDYAVY